MSAVDNRSSSALPTFQPGNRHPRAAFWVLVGVIVVVPLALAPGLQFSEVTPKLLVLVAGACLVWLTLAARNWFPAFRGRQARFFLLLGALALTGLLATVFSSDWVLSFAGSEGRRKGCLPGWPA